MKPMKVKKIGYQTTLSYNEWIELIYNNEFKSVIKTKDLNTIYKALNEAFIYISNNSETGQSDLLDTLEKSLDKIEKLNINL